MSLHRQEDIQQIIDVAPEVVSHNMETVRRLTKKVRIQARYDRSLDTYGLIDRINLHFKVGTLIEVPFFNDTEKDILEFKVTSRNNNASNAAKLFRDSQCVYNDYRTIKIITNAFNYLIQKFRIEEGSIKLTNTSKNIGDMIINVLDARESNSSDSKSIMVGDFILDLLIENRYLQLLVLLLQ